MGAGEGSQAEGRIVVKRWTDEVKREVEAAGGSVRFTADGHLLVLSKSGKPVGKIRTAGKDAGDNQGRTGRSILRKTIRNVAEG